MIEICWLLIVDCWYCKWGHPSRKTEGSSIWVGLPTTSHQQHFLSHSFNDYYHNIIIIIWKSRSCSFMWNHAHFHCLIPSLTQDYLLKISTTRINSIPTRYFVDTYIRLTRSHPPGAPAGLHLHHEQVKRVSEEAKNPTSNYLPPYLKFSGKAKEPLPHQGSVKLAWPDSTSG